MTVKSRPLPRRRLTRPLAFSPSSLAQGGAPTPTSAKEIDCSSSTRRAGAAARAPHNQADAPPRDGRVGARRRGPNGRGRAASRPDAAAATPAARPSSASRSTRFPNGAVTGVLLLAQSHLSIHTWPELALANVDLLTCGDIDGDVVLGRSASGSTSSGRTLAASDGRLAEQRAHRRARSPPPSGSPRASGASARFWRTLARLEPVSTRRISRAAELPVPIVAAVCGELRKRAIVAEERPTRLTPAGRELFAAGGLRLGRTAACPGCGGRGIVVPPALSPLVRELSRAVRGGPPARLELDQCHCTVDTKLRRLLAVHEAGALVGRRVLLLGDDDLTALALRLLVRRPRLALDDREPRRRGRRSRARLLPRARARRSAVPDRLHRARPPPAAAA